MPEYRIYTVDYNCQFEMEDGSENQAEERLKAAVGEFERFIEGGPTGLAKTNVKRGSVKVATVRQGSIA